MVLGTNTGFTGSLHWADSPPLSQDHTNSLLASDSWRESTKCFWSPKHLLSTQRASVISVTVMSCPWLSFQGPVLWSSPTHFHLCSSNSLGQGSLSFICLKDHFGHGKRTGALCYFAYKDTCTWVLLEYTMYSQSPKTTILGSHLQSNLMNHKQTRHLTTHLILGFTWIIKVVCISSSVLSTSCSEIQTS